MSKPVNPQYRVDVLLKRVAALLLERSMELHPLHRRLKQEAGLDVSAILQDSLASGLKRERITNVKSVMKALRK